MDYNNSNRKDNSYAVDSWSTIVNNPADTIVDHETIDRNELDIILENTYKLWEPTRGVSCECRMPVGLHSTSDPTIECGQRPVIGKFRITILDNCRVKTFFLCEECVSGIKSNPYDFVITEIS